MKIPGLSNVWIPPIRNRIDMLATGIKTPIGVKVSCENLADLDAVARQVEGVARKVQGVSSALATRHFSPCSASPLAFCYSAADAQSSHQPLKPEGDDQRSER